MINQSLVKGLKTQSKEIEELLNTKRDSSQFKGWKSKTARLLERIFGKDSPHLKDFKSVNYHLTVFYRGMPDFEIDNAYKKGLKNARAVLNSIIEELEEFGLPEKRIQSKNTKSKSNNVTVNLNQSLNINISNVLESNLTVYQYKELDKILKISDKKEKESKLSDFLINLGSSGMIEILKALLLGS